MSAWEEQHRLLLPSCGGGNSSFPQLPISYLRELLDLGRDHGSETQELRSAECLYQRLERGIQIRVRQCLDATAEQQHALVPPLLQAGAQCLHVFVRHNISGPWQPPPPSPIALLAPELSDSPASLHPSTSSSTAPETSTHAASSSSSAAAPSPGLGIDTQHPHERWAAQQLALDGEYILGGVHTLQYLMLAGMLLVHPLLGPHVPSGIAAAAAKQPPGWAAGARERLLTTWPSWAWWAARTATYHQQALDGRSAQLWVRLQLLSQQLLSSWAAPAAQLLLPPGQALSAPPALLQPQAGQQPAEEACVGGLAARPATLACLLMELALGHYAYGHVDVGERLLTDAGAALGLEVQLSGALGRRTVHQVDAKAQLVVRAGRARRAAPDGDHDVAVTGLVLGVDGVEDGGAAGGGAAGAGDGGKAVVHETAGLRLEEDVFMAPHLVDEEGQELASVYSGVEQALLLSWAKHVRTATAQDELQVWQMAPYVEAVLMQKRSQPMLQAQAQLLKVRHESNRNRTRERALVHMEQLVEVMASTPPGAAAAVMAPPTPPQQGEKQQQQANGAGALGPPDAAAESAARRLPFVHCTGFPLATRLRRELAHQYLALGFVGAAVKLFETLEAWDALIVCYRLMEKKHMAEEIIRKRLLVTPDDPSLWCSLGDLHMDDQYYHTAWDKSGGKYARSKRSLGRSALQRKAWAAAAGHYESALALNPLNPDAWFALGYAYLKQEGCQHKALKAFTRVTQQQPDHSEAWNNMAALFLDIGRHKEAFSALAHCVRHKRDSWQIWENYASVALKTGAYMTAAQALKQVLQITHGQRLPLDTMKALVDSLDRPPGALPPAQAAATLPAADVAAAEALGSGAGDAGWAQGQEDLGAWLLDLPGLMPAGGLQAIEEEGEEEEEGLGAAGGDAAGGEAAVAGAEAGGGFSQYERDVALAAQRTQQQLRVLVGQLLKEAVNLPCCSPGLWGCLGHYYRVVGQEESAKEALLKQVRGLTGTSYKSDEGRFVEMATASTDLALAYVQLYKASLTAASASNGADGAQPAAAKPATRELSAARMQLRGVLKQCEQAFSEHVAWKRMDDVLKEVVLLEDEAAAAKAT